MKTLHTMMSISLAILMSSTAFAQVNNKPCMNIAAACEKAGFRISGPSGKSIWPDCVKPILAGQTVNGVTPNPADVQACKEKKAQRKMQHMQNMQNMQQQQPTVTQPTPATPTTTAPASVTY